MHITKLDYFPSVHYIIFIGGDLMAKNPLRYERDNYNPAYLRNNFEIKELRKEYSRLRGIANKRLKAIGRYNPQSQVYKRYADKFVKLSTLNDRQIPYKLTELADFLSRRLSSVTEIKRFENETIKSLHEDGYTFINKSNIHDFFKFMDDTRTAARNSRYDSDRVVALFEMSERLGVNPDTLKKDFTYYMENLDALERIDENRMERINDTNLRSLLDGNSNSRRNRRK